MFIHCTNYIYIILCIFWLFGEVINYINPLSEPIVSFIAKNYVEKEYDIDVDIDVVKGYFPEPSEFSVYFTMKDEPYIKFSYSTNLSFSNRDESYYDSDLIMF